jgi:hypothetical protein
LGAQAPKGLSEQSNGSCSFRAPPTAATPARIHRSQEVGLNKDSRLSAGPDWPTEDPLPSRVVCYMLTRLHRWYQGSERAHRDSSKYQHTRGIADGAVEASGVVTKTMLALRKNKVVRISVHRLRVFTKQVLHVLTQRWPTHSSPAEYRTAWSYSEWQHRTIFKDCLRHHISQQGYVSEHAKP